MIKLLALFTGFGLAYSGFPADSAAQELISPTANTVSIPTAEMGQETFISPPAIQNNNGPSFGGPVVVLPVPLPPGGTSGSNNTYGFQYPGSYIPRDTPLHRFNGYIVCDPPNTVGVANGGTTSESTGAPIGRRMVKITTTRSLAAPGYPQPCPIYTINGEIQKNSGYPTKSPR
jgi:hypothetical protein